MKPTDALLREIETFLARTGMGVTTFGRKAVNDGKLVSRLKAGGSVTIGKAEEIREYIKRMSRPSATKQNTRSEAA